MNVIRKWSTIIYIVFTYIWLFLLTFIHVVWDQVLGIIIFCVMNCWRTCYYWWLLGMMRSYYQPKGLQCLCHPVHAMRHAFELNGILKIRKLNCFIHWWWSWAQEHTCFNTVGSKIALFLIWIISVHTHHSWEKFCRMYDAILDRPNEDVVTWITITLLYAIMNWKVISLD